jgi:hypothetical protein
MASPPGLTRRSSRRRVAASGRRQVRSHRAGPQRTLMAGREDQVRRMAHEAGGAAAEDAEAEERATDEGMPEHPDRATSGAAAFTDRGPITPPGAGPHGPVTVDDDQEDDGGHDLGGEA